MVNKLTRMWINQPSTLQPLHARHGTNVLAQPYDGDRVEVFFLSGEVVSLITSKETLSPGWRPLTPATQEEVVEVVVGLHKALDRMIHKHDPDSIEAEWLGNSNELHRKLTGMDVPHNPPVYA
jgi:hypothetical protein